jgi:ribonuclease HI
MPDAGSNPIPEVELFTDGGCDPNPGLGGYGVVLKFGTRRKELSGAYRETTNNRMELMAAIVGLSALLTRCRVRLTSDSEYLVESINKGRVKRWQEQGWWRSVNQRVANHDLWAKLLSLLAKHEVVLIWTKGHAGNSENERCDALARLAVQSSVAEIDEGHEQSKAGSPQSIPEGHPCFKCSTPLIKRIPKKRKAKADRAYTYDWYLYCPGCSTMYMTDEGKRVTAKSDTHSLFDEELSRALRDSD